MSLDLRELRLAENHEAFGNRKLASMAVISRAFFYPSSIGFGRGEGSIIPDKHQLIPLDLFNKPWLPQLQEVEGSNLASRYHRNRLLISDEGGLGKTHAAGISAINCIKNGEVVVAIVPLRTIKQWKKAFKEIGLGSQRIYGHNMKRGEFSTTKVNIISKWAIPEDNIMTSLAKKNLSDVGLCILDEAHEGFIASDSSNEREERLGVLTKTIKHVFQSAKTGIALTATPMRHDWIELIKLMQLLLTEEKLQLLKTFENNVLSSPKKAESWLNELKQDWYPTLLRLELGTAGNNDKKLISSKLSDFCPLLSSDESAELFKKIDDDWNEISSDEKVRFRLARDLQPFGMVMNSTLRNHLGEEHVISRYRERNSKSINFGDPYSGFKHNLNSIEKRCIMNTINSRYGRYESVWKDKELEIRDQIKECWASDLRLQELGAIIKGEIRDNTEDANLGRMRGLVVFAHDVGTGNELKSWIESNFEQAYVAEMYSGDSDDDEDTADKNADIEANLRFNSADSSQNRKLSILICGDGGAVGLDMEWATTMIHWDLWGGAENLAQRSWRLDRRWPENGGPIKIKDRDSCVTKNFDVIFFVTDNDNINQLNQKYRDNRILLCDRRFLEDDWPELIPSNYSKLVTDRWSENARPLSLSTETVIKNWQWCIGNLNDTSGLAELLNLKFLNSLLGMEIGGFNQIHSEEVNEIVIAPSNFDSGGMTHWGRIIALASPEERPSIKRLFGDFRSRKEPITTFGKPDISSGKKTISILPTGRLSTILRNATLDFDYSSFPLLVQEDSLHDKNVKHHFYFVDLGILRLYENELFYIASEVFGNSLPSGLLRTSPTEYDIKIGELDRHSIILERFLTTDKSYSYSFDYDEYIHTELIPRVVKRTMNFHYDTSVLIEKLQFLKNRGKSFNLDEVYSYIESIKNHVPDKKDIFPIVFLGQCGNCWNN